MQVANSVAHLGERAMATVKDLLAAKGSRMLSVGPDATVLDAALLMNEHRIGSLLVIEAGELRGIITERDFLRRVVAERRDPSTAKVRDVSEFLVVRSFGRQPQAEPVTATQESVVQGLERLFREIDTYLEFVAIARGR